MLARWWTLVVWALVAAGALFWGLRLLISAPPLSPSTPVASLGPVVRGDLTRLLGADPAPVVAATAAPPPPDARFQLIGVVTPRAPGAASEGLALIAVDGRPAKAFRVGAVVEGQTILKSVAARGAMLGPRDGAPQVTLSLAPPSAATTGALPSLTARPVEAADAAPPAMAAGRDRPGARGLRGLPPAMPAVDATPRGQPGSPIN